MAPNVFDFERMLEAFEGVNYTDGQPSSAACVRPPRLPYSKPFLLAMNEVALLFESLGSGFSFVRRDIVSKVGILHAHTPVVEDLTDAVLAENPADGTAGIVAPGKPAATRTLLRLMWACRFLDVLMNELMASFAAGSASESGASESDDGRRTPVGSSRTLRDAVSRAYDVALREHHSWGIRRAVSAAVYLLPSKEQFVEKLGVDISRRDEYFLRINESLTPLVRRMYAFYDLHNLHD